MSTIHRHRLNNGLWLIAETTPAAKSLAMTWLLPAGTVAEPEGRQGVTVLLDEMIHRGAGGLSAREHSDALDRLGVQRGSSVESLQQRVTATMIGDRIGEALPLIVDMVRRPTLPEPAFEAGRDLALQAIESLEDEPQQKVFIRLRERHYPAPLSRSPLGDAGHLQAMTLDDVRDFHAAAFVPEGSILSFAGHFDWPRLRDQVEELLADWSGTCPEPALNGHCAHGYHHEIADSSQVHIGLAYPAAPETDPSSVLYRTAAAVLSGGMSGRLFTEVREKQGLCYSVHASYAASRHMGVMLGYAGTTAPRAQKTLDVLTHELRRLSEGITAEEFERAVVGMKSRLVMQGESTRARSSAIAYDQYTFGEPRTLERRAEEIDKVTLKALNDFVRDNPPGKMTIVTIGPSALRVD